MMSGGQIDVSVTTSHSRSRSQATAAAKGTTMQGSNKLQRKESIGSAVLLLIILAATAVIAALIAVGIVAVAMRFSDPAPLETILSTAVEASPHGRRLSYLQQEAQSGGSIFMSDYCLAMAEDDQLLGAPISFSIIITARDEPKDVLLKTVSTVLANSSPHEGQVAAAAASVSVVDIVIVDDASNEIISEWPEWEDIRHQMATSHHNAGSDSSSIVLTHVRLSTHRGITFAKNKGANVVYERHMQAAKAREKQERQKLQGKRPGFSSSRTVDAKFDSLALVFLDAHALVSPLWLVPLAHSLGQHPAAMVYPVIDILTHDVAPDADPAFRYGVVKSSDDSMVMGFDWSLRPRWERITASSGSNGQRVKAGMVAGGSEALSPSAPGIFALTMSRFRVLGGFDSALYDYFHAQDATEMSIRNWLCGGLVIRQQCSRVAHRVKNLHTPSAAGQAVTQYDTDLSVMKIAEKWFDAPIVGGMGMSSDGSKMRYADVVYQSRFVNRIPYAVDTTGSDPIAVTPAQSTLESLTPSGVDGTLQRCMSIQWFLDEVYPGLADEVQQVQLQFSNYIKSGYLEKQPALQQLLEQYRKTTEGSVLKESNHATMDRLQARQQELLKNSAAVIMGGTARAEAAATFKFKRVFKEPAVKAVGMSRSELILQRAAQVRSEMLCQDFNDPIKEKSCTYRQHAAATGTGPKDWCVADKANLLFHCPKTCGFCAIEDGKFCEDFYLSKCPVWAAEGKCGKSDNLYGDFNDVCRKSCGQCTPVYSRWPDKFNNPSNGGTGPNLNHNAENEMPKPIVKVQDSGAESNIQPLTVDPGHLHGEYLSGAVPDDPDVSTACSVRGKPEGQMLSKFKIADLQAAGLQSPSDPGLYLDSDGQPLRIFCGIYTMEKNHPGNVMATRNSWAKRCDGFIAFSTVEDASIPTIKIEHEGDEAYDNMWQKSRAIWKFIHHHLRNDYDFFLLGGDDMFYIFENLRYYLGSTEITRAKHQRNGLFIGRLFQPPNQIKFNSGGAGYILDRKALDILGRDLDKERCRPHQRGFWEDVNIANCLKSSEEHIVPYPTRDPMERERFHPFTPGMHLTYRIPKNPDWYAKYNPDLRIGYDCCSDYSISFHYAPEKKMKTLYNFMYHCANKS